MFSLDEEEDDDFSVRPEISSKLANLFEKNDLKLDIESSNKTLIYTAPKQPKKIEINTSGDNPNPTTAVMTLIKASAVNVFKFENDKYSAQGKLGAALLGSHSTGSYKLILYTGKQQHITYATISDSFKLICQPNNYISFYDDNRQNWSVMFDTEEEKCNFCLQLTVCKFNAIQKCGNKSSIVTQDLTLGNENSLIVVEDRVHIELGYKGWLFEDNQTDGKLFANIDIASKKSLRMKLSGKWTQILKGMKMGGKRFAIIPFDMKNDWTEILENAPLDQSYRFGFEFEIFKIQNPNQKPTKPQKSEMKPRIDSKETTLSGNESQKVTNSGQRSHSSSLSDPNKDESHSSKTKSELISRVTRMGGLPILPVKVEPPETMTTENEINQLKPFPKPRNNSLTSNYSQSNQSMNSTENLTEILTQNAIPSMSTTSYSTPIPQYFTSQNMETNLSILTSETRTNNSEIRINLNKILDKIDSVSEKVNDIKNSSPVLNSMSMSSIGFMDSAILLSSIQRIVNENNNLKKELEDKTSNLQKLNEKICDLLQQQNINSNSSHKSSQELDKLLMNESRLQRELIVLTEDIDRIRKKNDDLNEENSRLRQTIADLKTEFDMRANVGQQSDKEFVNQIKRTMNDLFRKINDRIEENRSYNSDEIIEIVSNCIRSSTLCLMDAKNNSRTTSPFRQPMDEIDRNHTKCVETDSKDSEKPSIPQRKSIETQRQTDKRHQISQDIQRTNESIETNEDSKVN